MMMLSIGGWLIVTPTSAWPIGPAHARSSARRVARRRARAPQQPYHSALGAVGPGAWRVGTRVARPAPRETRPRLGLAASRRGVAAASGRDYAHGIGGTSLAQI